MPADQQHDELARVEAACAELAAAGQPVTFSQVAARAEPSRRGHGTHGPTSTSVIHRSFGRAASYLP